MVQRLRVHILHEHKVHPHSSAFIRLLQPLTHPIVAAHVQASRGTAYQNLEADVVIVDRLWHPEEITLEVAKTIVNEIYLAGASFVYALDDDFFAIPTDHPHPPTKAQLQAVEYFLKTADMVWVTTPDLQARFQEYNPHILVLPNCLDERLLIRRSIFNRPSPFEPGKKVIGYMGTLTHDADLAMVAPALREVCSRHPELEIQIIGIIGRAGTHARLGDLPIRSVQPMPGEETYPIFMLWYTGWVSWDIAISPLEDTDFNRMKSDLKVLDYAAIGAVGIYSDLGVYRASVVHQENGWLSSNHTADWVNALETLLSDDEYRLALAQRAQQYLFTSRILKHRAADWLEALRQLPKR